MKVLTVEMKLEGSCYVTQTSAVGNVTVG